MDSKSKYTIIEKVVRTEDDAVLHQIAEILDFNQEKFWQNIDPALEASLQRGIEQSDRHEGIPHEEIVVSLKKRKRI